MSYKSELEGRKIKYVKLHGGDTFIPGYGSMGSTLPPPSKSLNLVMVHAEPGVYVNINNSAAESLIPWANIQIVVYDSETVSPLQILPFASKK